MIKKCSMRTLAPAFKTKRGLALVRTALLFSIVSLSTASHAQLTADGSETKVNPVTANMQAAPAAAMDTAGRYFVAWDSYLQDGDGYGIRYRYYTADGTGSGTHAMNTNTTGEQRSADIACAQNGAGVVAWMTMTSPSGDWDINARLFDATGAPQGTDATVNTTTGGQQMNPAVAVDQDGDYVVVWQEITADLSGYLIRFQRYNSAGVAQGSEATVASGASYRGEPDVDMDAAGNFVVVWQESSDGSGLAVRARRYNSSGTALAAAVTVNTTTTGNQQAPSVAIDSDGDYVIVWSSYDQDGDAEGIYGQQYTSGGVADGSEWQISTTTAGAQTYPCVTSSLNGYFSVAWASYGTDGSYDGVYIQAYDSARTEIGTETTVNTRTTDFQQMPAVAMLTDSGNVVVVWQDGLRNTTSTNDGDEYGVYHQRFTVGEPLTVAADSVDATCFGENGTVNATPNGGTSPYTYLWSNGVTTASQNVLAGLYIVTVTDSDGRTAIDSTVVNEPTDIVVVLTVDSNVSCQGLADGGLSSAVSGGTSPYNYLWSNAATTANITGLAAAAYTLTVTDANGCEKVMNETISEPAVLVAVVTVDSNVSCNGGANGGLTASETGGTSPFTYLWTTAATTASITDLTAGSYTVTITDANGCTDTETGSIVDGLAVETTKVRTTYCGTTLSTMSDIIKCDAVANAERYEWKIEHAGTAFSETWLTPLATPTTTWFAFSFLAGESYGLTYDVSVRVMVNGCWGDYGTVCSMTTPAAVPTAQLVTANCGITLTSIYQYLRHTGVPGALRYRYTLTDGGSYNEIAYSLYYAPTSRKLYLGMFPNLSASTTYSLTVSAYVEGAWGPEGTACDVTTPAVLKYQPGFIPDFEETVQYDLLVYPNPSRGNFSIAMRDLPPGDYNTTLELYDLTGRMVWKRQQLSNDGQQLAYINREGSIASGTYILHCIVDGQRYVRKLVIEQ